MATFPKSESKTETLIERMIDGFANNAAIYPSPPVTTAALSALLSGYTSAANNASEAQAKAEKATTLKNEALQAMIKGMKSDLRYAELTVDFNDDDLKLIGWGGHKEATPLQPPGEPLTLIAPEEGEGWILLKWEAPLTGGAVASYQIERRERPSGAWGTVGLAMETEYKLTDQERGIEWEYRVKAVNKAGIGPKSSTVMAVL